MAEGRGKVAVWRLSRPNLRSRSNVSCIEPHRKIRDPLQSPGPSDIDGIGYLHGLLP